MGGRYHFALQPPAGEVFHLSGEFLGIQAPSALSCTFAGTSRSLTTAKQSSIYLWTPFGERTQLTDDLKPEFATNERLELHRDGWTDSFKKLDALVKAGRRLDGK